MKDEDNFDLDTDEEIEKIRRESAKPKADAAAAAYEMDTDEEVEKIKKEKFSRVNKDDDVDSDEAYAAETGIFGHFRSL